MRSRLILSALLVASFFTAAPSASASTCYTLDGTTITTGNACTGVLVVPEGVTAINDYAFYQANITSITLPNSLTTIGEGIFYRNETLTSVTFGSGLLNMGASAFAETRLTSVTLPNSLVNMGHGAFWGIPTLTSVTLGTGLIALPTEAFWGARITSLTIPGNVKSVGIRAFYSNESLTAVTLAEGIETINDSAFGNTTVLTGVTIPQSVYSLSSIGFAGSGYTVPDSVTTRVANKAQERAAQLAAAAEAQSRESAAEALRKIENAKSMARDEALKALNSGGKPKISDLLAAGFDGINETNVEKLQYELRNLKSATLADLVRTAKQVRTIEILSSSLIEAKRLLPRDLADIGISALASKYKSTIMRRILESPASSLTSFEDIQALANQYLVESQDRFKRTQSIVNKINSRNKQ